MVRVSISAVLCESDGLEVVTCREERNWGGYIAPQASAGLHSNVGFSCRSSSGQPVMPTVTYRLQGLEV